MADYYTLIWDCPKDGDQSGERMFYEGEELQILQFVADHPEYEFNLFLCKEITFDDITPKNVVVF